MFSYFFITSYLRLMINWPAFPKNIPYVFRTLVMHLGFRITICMHEYTADCCYRFAVKFQAALTDM